MDNLPNTQPANARQRGFALIEAMVAILVFAFGLLGIVGLQATMIKGTSDAQYRATASYVAQQKIGEMWGDSTKRVAGTESTDALPGGEVEVTANAPTYTVTVTWTNPGSGDHTYTTTTVIAGD